MFIAHLPAGVLCAKIAARGDVVPRRLWIAALLGSIFPDLDLFYFYFYDGHRTLHHEYWTHLPAFWLGCLPLLVLGPSVRMFLLNVFLHLLLDTVAGGVLWLWPLSHASFVLFEIPAVHGRWWVWNFVLHWTFGLELLLVALAAWQLFRARPPVSAPAL